MDIEEERSMVIGYITFSFEQGGGATLVGRMKKCKNYLILMMQSDIRMNNELILSLVNFRKNAF